MKAIMILALAGWLVLAVSGPVAAETLQAAELAFVVKVDALEEAAYAEVAPTGIAIPEGKRLASVFLEFQAELKPGQEVELWVDTGADRKPWELREDYALRKAHWVADERTGSLVRLDITNIARTWIGSTIAPPRLLIRVAPDGEGVVEDFQPVRATKVQILLRAQ